MKLFISYASAYRDLAERLRLALEAEGHHVFTDRADLKSGEAYNEALRRAIEDADLFIFLVSPESVAAGSYALTELGFAQARWRKPAGRILPVIVAPTPIAGIPPYLRAVTLLQPKGDAVAEATAAVAGMSHRSVRGAVIALTLIVVGVVGSAGWYAQRSAAQRSHAELQRQLAVSTQLCEAADFPVAWRQLSDLARLHAGDPSAARAQQDCAMRWLRHATVPEGKQTFTELVAGIEPVLAGGLAGSTGQRAADLRAHLGWAGFLRSRDGAVAPDLSAHYRRALQDDPQNVYAHAMWAHWLLWTSGADDEARKHYAAALQSGRDRGYVREMQLASYLENRRMTADGLKVADEMRVNGEPIDEHARRELWNQAFYLTGTPTGSRSATLGVLPPPALLATFEWLFPQSGVPDHQRQLWHLSHAVVVANAGDAVAARAELTSLLAELQKAGSTGPLLDQTKSTLAQLKHT